MMADTPFIISRVFIVFTLMVAGLVGSSLILAVFIKDKTQPGRVFMLTLAVVDMIGSVVLLPQLALWEMGTNNWNVIILPQVVLARMVKADAVTCFPF